MQDSSHNFYSKIQNTGNFLIVKDDVGKSKPVTRTLPSNEYSYGVKISKDRENAGAVISSWAETHKRSRLEKGQDFKRLNILSIGEKQVTAPQQRIFRKTAKYRRMSSETPQMNEENREVIFGVPLRPSTPIKAVLGHFYGFIAAEEKHRAYSRPFGSRERKRTSIAHVEKAVEQPKILFKMKKFLNVKPRISTRRSLTLS